MGGLVSTAEKLVIWLVGWLVAWLFGFLNDIPDWWLMTGKGRF